jgi:hypothetical protein
MEKAVSQKLVVVLPFSEIEGQLVAMEAVQCESEGKAKALAEKLSKTHAGVLAWTRSADPNIGEYGPPTEIVRMGRIPDEIE